MLSSEPLISASLKVCTILRREATQGLLAEKQRISHVRNEPFIQDVHGLDRRRCNSCRCVNRPIANNDPKSKRWACPNPSSRNHSPFAELVNQKLSPHTESLVESRGLPGGVLGSP